MKKNVKIKVVPVFFRALAVVAGIIFLSFSPFAGGRPAAALESRLLDDKSLGHFRHLIYLSEQPSPAKNQADGIENDVTSSFYLTVLAHAIGLVHYHYTPACPEMSRQAMNRVIQKMLGNEVAGSRPSGGSDQGPKMLGAQNSSTVPPRENVMFSGHLLATAGLYTMLFNDTAYTKAGSLPIDDETTFPGLKEKKRAYNYNLKSLAEAIWAQYQASPMGFICDYNSIFLFCNGYTFYGFRYYDQVFGTDYLKPAAKHFLAAWEEKGGFLRKEGHFVEAYLIAQDFFWIQPSAYFDAWAGTWMHAWNPGLIETLYPNHVAYWVKWLPDNTAYVEPRPEMNWSLGAPSDFGHFALYAAEMGDREVKDAMLAYAEKKFSPVWKDGRYYYPTNDKVLDEEELPVSMNRLAGDVLLGFARINFKDGIRTLFQEGVKKSHFNDPYIDHVAWPDILVRQAVCDPEQGTLCVVLTSGGKKQPTSFYVHQLSEDRDWTIWVDNRKVGEIKKGRESRVGSESAAIVRQVEKDTFVFSCVVEKDVTVHIKPAI